MYQLAISMKREWLKTKERTPSYLVKHMFNSPVLNHKLILL